MKKGTYVLLGALMGSNSVLAAGMSGWSQINKIGCHVNDSTCYMIISKAVGPYECASKSLRWDSSSAGGRQTLSLLTEAFMQRKEASFYIPDSCYNEDPRYPTFDYFSVRPCRGC
ncbi:MAG: hypothetical protein GYB33_08895 [Gammaproteobacteria bacterium]|uniref:hypothetical protein n=1 Tax=Pseudomaricurvus alcaniphilus TaxID=1166482 RepID=UPI0014074CB9|nr:hypothetical protein [Pseudomaricurvus alcaniphilus]MBR9910450.1 hypothetical protein [Gammaproteobacteria bacterium]NHN36153.1 hypothetical protein [Pseudomaricurvus alcaniphilus]